MATSYRWLSVGLAAAAMMAAGPASPAAITTTYGYDVQGRVVTVTKSTGDSVEYDYDKADNRTQKVNLTSNVPAAAPVFATVAYNTAQAITLQPKGAYSSLTITDNPDHGALSVSGTTATYTPSSGYYGADSFQYTVTGSGGTSPAGTVSLNVVNPSIPFTRTIQITGSSPVNLRSLANAEGFNGAQNATITFEVGNGVTIIGDAANGLAGVDTGEWPTTGFTLNLTLVVKTGGAIYGGGGAGGTGGGSDFDYGRTTGAPGGDAVNVQTPISITVQSGGAIKGGGAGGDGGPGADVSNGINDHCWGGGGGGGGFPNGPGGAGGTTDVSPWFGCDLGESGADGTTSGGGAGGAALAGSPDQAGGGAGGGPGGGYAIRKNGRTVPVSGSGTITGAAS